MNLARDAEQCPVSPSSYSPPSAARSPSSDTPRGRASAHSRVAQRRSSRADRHHLIAPRTAGTHSNITRETLPSMPHRRRSRSVRAREVPHVTRLPTVAGSALAVGIMQCAAWADLCGPILLRRRVIDRCYGVPSTGTVAACLTPTCVRDRAGSRQRDRQWAA